MLGRLEREWSGLLESYAGLSDDSLAEPGVVGHWSVRDVLAHITTWEEEALKAVSLMLAGRPPPRYSSYGGIDAFNERDRERKRSLPLEEVEQQLADTHQRLAGFLAGIPETAYSGGERLIRRLRLDTYGHYREHTTQVAAWRARLGL